MTQRSASSGMSFLQGLSFFKAIKVSTLQSQHQPSPPPQALHPQRHPHRPHPTRMYLQKHGVHRPSELIYIHLERLERDRVAAEQERRAAVLVAAGAAPAGEAGTDAMEEDAAGWPQHPPHQQRDAADVGAGEVWEQSEGGSVVRRSRRPKVGGWWCCKCGVQGQVTGCQSLSPRAELCLHAQLNHLVAGCPSP